MRHIPKINFLIKYKILYDETAENYGIVIYVYNGMKNPLGKLESTGR